VSSAARRTVCSLGPGGKQFDAPGGTPLTSASVDVFASLLTLTNLTNLPNGPGPAGATAAKTYRIVKGDAPKAPDDPRTFKENSATVYIDLETGKIAAVVFHQIWTDSTGQSENTSIEFDYIFNPVLSPNMQCPQAANAN
jgi:hypothetical protein